MEMSRFCGRCEQHKPPEAFGSHTYCRVCYNSWRRDWRAKNVDLVRAQIRRAIERDSERFKKYDRKSYLKNREKRIAKSRRWNIANKSTFAAREAARRAIQKSATPSWVDWSEIQEIYRKADERTRATGVLHHVDHLVPLKSKIVCGLHVPWNLRVVTAEENQAKGNRVWPDMPSQLLV